MTDPLPSAGRSAWIQRCERRLHTVTQTSLQEARNEAVCTVVDTSFERLSHTELSHCNNAWLQALSGAGELLGWGGNRNGELGQGTVGDAFNPVPIVALAGHRLRQV